MNGTRQSTLLARAGASGLIMLNGSNAEDCAARRLVRRDHLVRIRLGGPGPGYVTVYRVVKP